MEPTTPAEHQLLADTHTGHLCDLRTDTERKSLSWKPTAKDAACWTDDRVVRADYLRHLLIDKKLPINLIGARIDGDLHLEGGRAVTLNLPQSVLTGTARFGGATFTGDAVFAGATFTG
ncbi:pentapeptide repeat-containing protein, partial [Gordonia alkanivorans]|uniref:pentapeptide repeat-containing protein n=1 Tax=Gordonia alkanivorans TaxID=84096 RepID=UPI0005A90C66